MNSDIKTARIVGVLFIIGTIAGISSQIFLGPILDASDYLLKLSAMENQVLIGMLFMLIMAAACASIAIWLYPILRKYDESLALGAVGFRLMEGMLDILVVVCLVLLLALSQEFINAGAPASSYFQAIGALLLAGYHWVGNVAVLLVWCIGALMYYYIFYQTRLIPRWLSGWGLAGAVLCIIASLLVMFRLIGPMSAAQAILNLPIALQEMAMAIWLIFKGFNTSPTVVELSKPLKT